MNRLLFLLITLTCFQPTYADPFDRQQRNNPAPILLPNNAHATNSQCFAQQPSFFSDTPLQALKLIGVIEQNQQWKALFLDKNQQIISVKTEDVISQERLKIAQISKKQVVLLRATTNNCEQLSQVVLTL